jgi:hypothetical protein
MRRIATVAVILGLTSALLGPASAAVILPNDDTYVSAASAGTNYDNPNPGVLLGTAGLLMKNQTGNQRVGFIEFTIPNVPATSATFNALYIRSWAAGTSWTFRLLGTVDSFDETTLTFTSYNASTLKTDTYTTLTAADITMPGGNSGQDVSPPIWTTVDITSFFNANLGQTVVLKCTSTSSTSNGNAGGTFEDREGSRTGVVANGPYIDFVPEPAAALLLVLGSLGLLRRRPA